MIHNFYNILFKFKSIILAVGICLEAQEILLILPHYLCLEV